MCHCKAELTHLPRNTVEVHIRGEPRDDLQVRNAWGSDQTREDVIRRVGIKRSVWLSQHEVPQASSADTTIIEEMRQPNALTSATRIKDNRYTPSGVPLTVGERPAGSGRNRVELVVGVDQTDAGRYGLVPVKRIVARVALHEVVLTGSEAVWVEQARDTRAGHAAPVVVITVEHAGEHGHLDVACKTKRAALPGEDIMPNGVWAWRGTRTPLQVRQELTSILYVAVVRAEVVTREMRKSVALPVKPIEAILHSNQKVIGIKVR